MNPEMIANYSPGSRRYATIWDDVINAAQQERAYTTPIWYTPEG